MKKYFIISLLLVFNFANGQSNTAAGPDPQSIKLFVDYTDKSNADLTESLRPKLKSKIIQLVNQTGVAEIGFSNFLLYPEFYLNSSEVSETGVQKMTVVNCELNLFIGRILPGREKLASGVYASYNKKIQGSGLNKDAAISNAINSLRSDDKSLTDFLEKAKKTIADYFNKNCNEVVNEADRLYNLEKYNESISLYFSVPSGAPCYEAAHKKSIAVYKAFLNNECKADLVELKSTLAMAGNSNDKNTSQKYDHALEIFKQINPTTVCYEEALNLINKMEDKFDKRQKDEWDLTVKKEQDASEVQKEMYKAMGKVAANYQPPGNMVIIK